MEKSPQETANIPHTPLLATKLHLPRPSARLVHRSPLYERLAQGMSGALTLISAPAGFGKTTLLSDYLTRSATPVAWLSLEAGDNDLDHCPADA
jgi:LuxR family maltose regulon positive regulatory protein